MPVRSLNSPVLKWPGRAAVDAAVRALAARLAPLHPELERFGYFGSYARGDAGPGSDIDLVALVDRSGRAFRERALDFDIRGMPVPAELLVYTADEWRAEHAGAFVRGIEREAVWVFP